MIRKRKARADILIADLPCSGLGIIGRKSDIKYHITPEGQTELAALQRRIFDTIWRYVKPGGRLVYSTCTLFPSENRENAEWFAKNYPFEPESLAGRIPEPVFQSRSCESEWFRNGAGIRECSLRSERKFCRQSASASSG